MIKRVIYNPENLSDEVVNRLVSVLDTYTTLMFDSDDQKELIAKLVKCPAVSYHISTTTKPKHSEYNVSKHWYEDEDLTVLAGHSYWDFNQDSFDPSKPGGS